MLHCKVTVNSGFSVNSQKIWQDNEPEPKTDKTTRKFSPLISINSVILKQIQTNFSLSVTSEEAYDVSGSTRSFSVEDKVNTSTQIKYRLKSSRGIPLLKSLKLSSDINFTIDFSTTGNEKRRRIGDDEEEEPTLINSTDSWSVSPKIDYQFSRKFTGGASMNFSNSKDMTNKVRKVREVSIWGKLTF